MLGVARDARQVDELGARIFSTVALIVDAAMTTATQVPLTAMPWASCRNGRRERPSGCAHSSQ